MKFIFVSLLCLSLTAQADYLSGKVVRVADGDSITILDANSEQHRVRLSGIDAPERGQAFSRESKGTLSAAVSGKTVTVDWNKRDRYGRIIGKVILDGRDINLEQIKMGMAWHYKEYEREQDVEDRSLYAQMEYLAKRDKVGLWADNSSVAPWDFRKSKRGN